MPPGASKGTGQKVADILDLLRADAGRITIAQLLGERAVAAAEIARLRVRIEVLEANQEVPASPRPGHSAHAANNASPRTAQQPATPLADPFPAIALIRLKDVCRLVGVGKSTIYMWISDGTFPEPVRISERSVRWRMQDVAAWISAPTGR